MISNSRQAIDPKTGLTLDELGQFVQTSMRLGLDGNSPTKATIGWRGQVLAVTVTGQAEPAIEELTR